MENTYVMRHAGASRDILHRSRTLPEVQDRGGWAHPASVKQYEQHAEVQRVLHKMGTSALASAQLLRAQWGIAFRG